MKKGNIFWGILLVTLGIIFILRNMDLFYFNFHSLFRLWPLIFVFWGIAILPVKSFIKLILSGAAIVIAILILSLYPSEEYSWFRWNSHDHTHEYNVKDSWNQQHLTDSYDSVLEIVKLDLDAAAGKFYIKNQTQKLYEIDNEGGFGSYSAITTRNGNDATIKVRQEQTHIHNRDFKNTVWLALNPQPVWEMNIEVGAAGLEMDVTPFKVEKIDIKGGASSLELRLGEQSAQTKVNIDAGASSIEIKIPEASGCELHTSTVLSSRDLEGFEKISTGLYRTSNFSNATNQIIIDVEAAVSSLSVIRY